MFIIRTYQTTTNVDLAWVEPDSRYGPPFPKFTEFFRFRDWTELRTQYPDILHTEGVCICPTATTVFHGDEVVLADDRNDGAVQMRFARSVLTAHPSAYLGDFPDVPVVAESACLVALFRSAYAKELADHRDVGFLHVGDGEVDLVVFRAGEPRYYGVEECGEQTKEGIVAAAETLLRDDTGGWRSDGDIELLVVSGASSKLKAKDITWLDEELKSIPVKFVEPERFLILSPSNSDAERNFTRLDSPVSQYGALVPMAGAFRQLFDGHGADFRGRIPTESTPSQNPGPNILAGIGNLGSRAFTAYLGVGVAFVLTALIVGTLLYRSASRDRDLTRAETLESQREAGNRHYEEQARKLRLTLEAINARIDIINRMRAAQTGNHAVTAALTSTVPPALKFTSVQITGRAVIVEGYVSIATAVAEQGQPSPQPIQPAPSPPPTPTPQPAIDINEAVARFSRALQDGGLFGAVQHRLDRAQADKVKFIITCNYTGPIYTDKIESAPIPQPVLDATKEAR